MENSISFNNIEYQQIKLNKICNCKNSNLLMPDAKKNGKYRLFNANEEIGKCDYGENKEYISIIKYGSGIGKVKIRPEFSNVIGTMGIINEKDSNLRYLFYLLQATDFRKYIEIGTAPNMYFEDFGEKEVFVPKLEYQKKIGSFLYSLESLIEVKKNELEKTKQYKEAMLYKMFPKEGSKVPEIRFKGFEGEWDTKPIGQLYEIYNGLNKEKEAFGFGVPIINYMDVNKNTYIIDDMIKGRVNLTAEEIRNNIVNKNDILFARTSEVIEEVSFSSCYYGDCKNVVFSGFLLKGSPLKEIEIDSRYVALYVKYCNDARSQINRIATKTSRALINGENLKKLVIKIPSIYEQNKIVNFFLNLDDYLESCSKEITILENYKATLLEKMFA